MIITPLTKKALEIAQEAHKGQVDKGGEPYIYHPIYVAERMVDEVRTIVALLHDVVEDTKWTLADLTFFGEDVIEALRLLTHDNDVPYQEYIEKLSKNPISRDVKMKDLAHNSDLTRLKVITLKDFKRAEKYKKSMNYLQSVKDKEKPNSYNKKLKSAI